jgi:ECF sigma factor
MNRELPGHLLQTTALVNEAYLRLIDASQVRSQNRAHFFAVSATVMRRILVDFARNSHKLKRGGTQTRFHWPKLWSSPGSEERTWWQSTMRSLPWGLSTQGKVRWLSYAFLGA